MMTPYNIEIPSFAVKNNLERICNQIFKLLPMREEGKDCEKPIETLIIELLGLSSLLVGYQELLLSLVSKLEGIRIGNEEIDFMLFRRSIFEACSLTNSIIREIEGAEKCQ